MFFSRGKNKIQDSYVLSDMYKLYIKDIKENSPYYIDYSTFVNINTLYFKKIINYLLETSLDYRLPYRLGSFQIIKKKINFRYQSLNTQGSIDWSSTVIAGKQVFYTNDHTDGYKYLFMWNKTGSSVTNITKYKFIPCRAVKRRLAQIIKNKERDYFEYK